MSHPLPRKRLRPTPPARAPADEVAAAVHAQVALWCICCDPPSFAAAHLRRRICPIMPSWSLPASAVSASRPAPGPGSAWRLRLAPPAGPLGGTSAGEMPKGSRGKCRKGHELTVDKNVLEAEKYRHGEKTSVGISGRRLSCDQPGKLPAGFVWETRDGWEL